MTTTINPRTSPHPLKGIVNTNDDPTQCARCQQNIDWNDTGDCLLLVCCGKVICDACAGTERFHCIFCRKVRSTTRSLNPKEMVSKVKKHAKRGYAWAQLTLGCIYLGGELSVSQSSFEAKRWFEKAARQNHPAAHHRLARIYLAQHSMPKKLGVMSVEDEDLSNAKRHADAVLSSSTTITSPSLVKNCLSILVTVGKRYCDDALDYKAQLSEAYRHAKLLLSVQILEPIATDERKRNRDDYDTQYFLGRAYGSMHNYIASREWCVSSFSAKCANNAPAIGALICCKKLGLWAQVKVWNGAAINTPFPPGLSNSERGKCVMHFVQAKRDLRKLRDFCSFCGITFSDTERKLCKGCRAICYCSRECQKMHWNHKKGGHREDCKGALELKKKLKEVMGGVVLKG